MTQPVTPSTPGQRPKSLGVRLARSAGAIGAATATSRVLGLVRDQVLAALFGASNELDAFIVAFRIPNLVRDLFAEGAMSAAFVPTFTRHLTRHGREDAWRLGNNVLNAVVVATALLVAIGMVFAHPLVSLYASSYARVPGKLELTVELTRVMLPFLILVAIAAAAMGMLNSLHHYFLPALSPAMFNVATIVCAFALAPVMPRLGLPRIMAIAIGALLGGLGQVLLQWPSLRREGFRYAPRLDVHDRGLREVLILMGPGTIGLAATQVNIFVNTLLATSQGTGAVSWLTFGFRLMYLPIGLVGVSIATAVLPAVSRHAAADEMGEVRHTVARGLALMLMLNVPATFGLITLATPIVQLLFQRGHFLAADTVPTAEAVRLYAAGLVGYSAVRIASPTFYALRRSRVPVIVSVCTVVLNVALSVTLVHVMGFLGLALGTSISALANGGTLVFLLRRQLDGIEGRRLGVTFVKIVAAALVMSATVLAVERGLLAALPGTNVAAQVLRLVSSIGLGVLALGFAARLLRIDEFDSAVAIVRGRLTAR